MKTDSNIVLSSFYLPFILFISHKEKYFFFSCNDSLNTELGHCSQVKGTVLYKTGLKIDIGCKFMGPQITLPDQLAKNLWVLITLPVLIIC